MSENEKMPTDAGAPAETTEAPTDAGTPAETTAAPTGNDAPAETAASATHAVAEPSAAEPSAAEQQGEVIGERLAALEAEEKAAAATPEGEKADRKKHVGVIVAAVAFAAPDFTMTDAEGATLTLADFKGKPVLLNFWASWCGPCQSEMPDIQAAWEEHGANVEFVIVNMTGMNGETEQSAKAFLADAGYTFPCYFDANNSAATAFGVSSIPQTYLINAEGNIIGAYMGAMDASVIAQGIDMLTGDTGETAAAAQ